MKIYCTLFLEKGDEFKTFYLSYCYFFLCSDSCLTNPISKYLEDDDCGLFTDCRVCITVPVVEYDPDAYPSCPDLECAQLACAARGVYEAVCEHGKCVKHINISKKYDIL